ncbi:hypothetical protein PB2503_02832 [Parvularcula bermudensis HTCC2503]|uniref:Co-chaperone DjlA N-terminal domain-containing protein n=1 Tax=Parvularcula bermudensis (strain ATCC BAA-594 / HTCC2503 / KCTC 12087) TaxID=314260 RepID=E0TCQ4_PARBH|nr:TerB family tellurite resistance protein [Parvularcula bermudensis]ADM08643.1 hypothetical protein PB2503_02832 [Parvularcula bermudensis HTCC2503]
MVLFAVLLGLAAILFAFWEWGRMYRHRQGTARRPGRLVETLSDPREAAAILLVKVAAGEDGQVTVEQKHTIEALMTTNFAITDDEAEGLYSFGRMAVSQIDDIEGSVPRLLKPIQGRLTLEEMKDLVQMMEDVAGEEAERDETAQTLITKTRKRLHLDSVVVEGP